MKKNHSNGQVLSEQEMKEVKGGEWYVIAGTPKAFYCDACGNLIYKFEYNALTETYVAVCDLCGCSKEVKVEE